MLAEGFATGDSLQAEIVVVTLSEALRPINGPPATTSRNVVFPALGGPIKSMTTSLAVNSSIFTFVVGVMSESLRSEASNSPCFSASELIVTALIFCLM
jgi:hypothetical protein